MGNWSGRELSLTKNKPTFGPLGVVGGVDGDKDRFWINLMGIMGDQ